MELAPVRPLEPDGAVVVEDSIAETGIEEPRIKLPVVRPTKDD
jgi:hypothetical protein